MDGTLQPIDSAGRGDAGPEAGKKPLTALVLQGGGALGAYHIGCYQAMEEAGYRPDWVSGISIGAFNAAIIAGNPPGQVLAKLEELWNDISWPDFFGLGAKLTGEMLRLYHYGSAFQAMLWGQPNFFQARVPMPFFAMPGTEAALSFGDNSLMRATLERLTSFERINAGPTRLSLGATKVTTGELVFFDSHNTEIGPIGPIGPEHVMASGALPPGFPPTRIDGELYWDGGCVSNTPLEAVTREQPPGHVLVFMVDLWDARGPEPQTIEDVSWRQLRIQYASRTSHNIDSVAKRLNARRALRRVCSRLSPEQLADPAIGECAALGCDTKMDLVHVIYHPEEDQIWMSDREFSRSSIAARRAAGYADMKAVLDRAPWFDEETSPQHAGAVVHHCKGAEVRSRVPLTARQSVQMPVGAITT